MRAFLRGKTSGTLRYLAVSLIDSLSLKDYFLDTIKSLDLHQKPAFFFCKESILLFFYAVVARALDIMETKGKDLL